MRTTQSPERELFVQTPSRLHLGIFDLPGGGYGGIGLAIADPGVRLAARPSYTLRATGPQADRALRAAEALRAAYDITHGADLQVLAAIPQHVGLGSGTQLSLAAAALLARVWHIDLSLETLAGLLGRGCRSHIGLEAFRTGGFVARSRWQSGETATRLAPVPADWRFVLAVPFGMHGLSGEAETTAFRDLGPMAPAMQQQAMHLVEAEILPAVQGADLRRFGAGLMDLQAIVGAHFAPVQGGRYAHPLGEAIARRFLEAGAAGVGQTSWGPAMCGVAGSQAEAEALLRAVSTLRGGDLTCWITAPANAGLKWEWHALCT